MHKPSLIGSAKNHKTLVDLLFRSGARPSLRRVEPHLDPTLNENMTSIQYTGFQSNANEQTDKQRT